MNLNQAEEAKEEVKKVLAQSPRQYGLEGNRWRLAFIRQRVSWLRGCTLAGVWQILKRLGFSYKQACRFIHSPDPRFRLKVRAITQAFSQALWHPDEAAILFEDELSYYQQPATTATWGLSGPKQLRVQGGISGNQLTRLGAAMDGITGRLLYHQADKFGLQEMQALYRLIRQQYAQPTVFVVQDNWYQVHDHASVLQTAQELNIIPLFLPTYASWLNPIEKLWRWLRQDVLHNHSLADNLVALRGNVDDFLGQFALDSPDLLHYCGLLPN